MFLATRDVPLHFGMIRKLWKSLVFTGCHVRHQSRDHPIEFSMEKTSVAESVDPSEVIDDEPINLKKDILIRISQQLKERDELKTAAAEQGITGNVFSKVLESFSKLIKNPKHYKDNSALRATVENIHEGKTHIDSLFSHLIDHARELYPLLYVLPELKKISDLTSPAQWYPAARAMRRHFVIHAGPTNSGKTHHALKAFFEAKTAVYCAPLRMLAAEINNKSNDKGVSCDLITGEERIYASGTREELSSHMSCTVEMVPTAIGTEFDVAIIDEVQMVRDNERGGAWTRAILGVPAKEIHLCGEATVIPLIERLVHSLGDTLDVKKYERLSPLVPLSKSLNSNYRGIKPGDCLIIFSRQILFRIKSEVEKATGYSCAVIYGGLPSANRQQQAKLFNSTESDVDVMVATDAIGMGVNLSIKRIVFTSLIKHDGKSSKYLTSSQAKQIAGRAGRFGTFDKGEVTTFYQGDLPIMKKLLSSPIRNIKKAGITPVFEQLELFSNQLPELKLHQLLNIFIATSKLNDNFFLCESALKCWTVASEALSNCNMSLKDCFTFSKAPVKMSNPFIMKTLRQYAEHYSKGTPFVAADVHRILNWPLPKPRTPAGLVLWENTHEVLDLYLWLGQRYPDFFPDAEKVRLLQKEIEEVIAKSIVTKSLKRRQFKAGPFIAPYPLPQKKKRPKTDGSHGTSVPPQKKKQSSAKADGTSVPQPLPQKKEQSSAKDDGPFIVPYPLPQKKKQSSGEADGTSVPHPLPQKKEQSSAKDDGPFIVPYPLPQKKKQPSAKADGTSVPYPLPQKKEQSSAESDGPFIVPHPSLCHSVITPDTLQERPLRRRPTGLDKRLNKSRKPTTK